MKKFPLIIEDHPDNYKGYKFISLLVYNEKEHLVIIDSVDNKCIHALVLDLCKVESIKEEDVISIALKWFNSDQTYPISIEFCKLDRQDIVQKIYRSFNINFTTRIIGTLPDFKTSEIKTTKRKKKKSSNSTVTKIY